MANSKGGCVIRPLTFMAMAKREKLLVGVFLAGCVFVTFMMILGVKEFVSWFF